MFCARSNVESLGDKENARSVKTAKDFLGTKKKILIKNCRIE